MIKWNGDTEYGPSWIKTLRKTRASHHNVSDLVSSTALSTLSFLSAFDCKNRRGKGCRPLLLWDVNFTVELYSYDYGIVIETLTLRQETLMKFLLIVVTPGLAFKNCVFIGNVIWLPPRNYFIVALHQNFSILKLLKLNSHETNSLMLVPTSLMHLKVVIQILEKLFLKLFLGSGHLISWEIMERDFQGWIVQIVI